MWAIVDFLSNILKLDTKGGIVPEIKPVEMEVYSTEWNWLVYAVKHERCYTEPKGFKISSKLITPTGNWMLETKFGGEQILHIEAKDEDNKVEYYREHCLKLSPEPQRFYKKAGG